MILDDHSYRHHRHDMTINICCPQLMVLTPTPATGWAAATSMVSSIIINVIVSLTVIVNTTIIIIVSNSGKTSRERGHHSMTIINMLSIMVTMCVRGGDVSVGQRGPFHIHPVGGGRTKQQRRWGDDRYDIWRRRNPKVMMISLLMWFVHNFVNIEFDSGLHCHEQPQLLQLARPQLRPKVGKHPQVHFYQYKK